MKKIVNNEDVKNQYLVDCFFDLQIIFMHVFVKEKPEII